MTIIQANKFYYLRGGAERYMLDLSDWLEGRGHTVVPFAMRYPSNLETPYDRLFVKEVTTRPQISWQGLRTAGRLLYSLEARRKMATLVTQTKPQLCHAHNIYTQLSPSILHTLSDQRVPVVMTVHDHHLVCPQYNVWADGCGPDTRGMSWLRAASTRFQKGSYLASLMQAFAHAFHRSIGIYRTHVKFFIAPSEYMKRQLIQSGYPTERIIVNAYGIDTEQVTPSFKPGSYMLFVGRLDEQKGVETIIRLAELIPEVTFKIVGRGPFMGALHRMGDTLDNVEFLGFRQGEELQELYRGASALLLPSRVHEVFPLTALEALACGVPVIASRVGGVPELIEDRVNGFLVDPLDLHSWTEAVMRLHYDTEFQEQMRRQARTRVEGRFHIRDHHRRLIDIYQRATDVHVAV